MRLFFHILLSFAMLAFADSWVVRLSLESSDAVFTDYYNYFGIDPTASRERDVNDALKVFPPYANYIVAYFPHDDPARPDYWLPPYNARYSIDIRNDQFVTEIFYFDINSTATTTRDVMIFWQEMISVSPSYKVEFGTSTGVDAVNLFCSDFMWRTIPPGVHHFRVSVQKEAYQRLKICPDTMLMFVNEHLWAKAYLFGPAGELVIPAEWYTGSGIISCENGLVTAVEHGVTSLVACFRGWCDTAIVVVLQDDASVRFDLPLKSGWNQVSFPVEPLTRDLYSLLGSMANDVWSFGDGFFSHPLELEYGKGYLVFSERDTCVMIYGVPRIDIRWDIEAGWNLVGIPYMPIFVEPILINIGAFPCVFYWNGLYYECGTFAVPGKGYWIFSVN